MSLDTENGCMKYGNRTSFMSKKMKEDSRDDPDATLCLEKEDVLRQAYYKYAREDTNGYDSSN